MGGEKSFICQRKTIPWSDQSMVKWYCAIYWWEKMYHPWKWRAEFVINHFFIIILSYTLSGCALLIFCSIPLLVRKPELETLCGSIFHGAVCCISNHYFSIFHKALMRQYPLGINFSWALFLLVLSELLRGLSSARLFFCCVLVDLMEKQRKECSGFDGGFRKFCWSHIWCGGMLFWRFGSSDSCCMMEILVALKCASLSGAQHFKFCGNFRLSISRFDRRIQSCMKAKTQSCEFEPLKRKKFPHWVHHG